METALLQAKRLETSFSGLGPDERRHLREWQTIARTIGIDAIEDLTSRPWPYPLTGTVIGVFRSGSEAAHWLVISQNGTWAVACCAEGTVSPAMQSLDEALAVIYPGQPGCGNLGLIR